MTEWPDPANLGYPLNPTVDGSHLLSITTKTDEPWVLQWNSTLHHWTDVYGTTRDPYDVDHMAYLGPCITPSKTVGVFVSTDEAPVHEVMAALKVCAACWDGDARVLGNVRAKDIVRAVDAILRPAGNDPFKKLYEEIDQSRALKGHSGYESHPDFPKDELMSTVIPDINDLLSTEEAKIAYDSAVREIEEGRGRINE